MTTLHLPVSPAVAQPPTWMPTPQTPQLAMTVGIGVACLLLLAYAVRRWVGNGDPAGVLVIAGGLVCSLNEPIVDILGLCYFPHEGNWRVFETFDRPMPLWLVLAYVAYFGGLTYVMSLVLRSGVSRRAVWVGIGGLWVVNLALELPALASDLYTYYGEQPFQVAGHPLAWLVINCEGSLLASVLIARYREVFRGSRALFLVLVPGACYFASWVIALPHFMSVNADIPFALKWVGSAVTIVCGLYVIDRLIRFGLAATPERERGARPAAAEAQKIDA